MTVAQLERAVAHLGFTSSLEDGDELFREAATRALGEISAARPRLATTSLWHLPDEPIFLTGSTEPFVGEKSFPLSSGRSYFARLHGRGPAVIEGEKGRYSHSFAADPGEPPAVIAGNLPSGEQIRSFSVRGENELRILTLAVYGRSFYGRIPDPRAPMEYDLAALFEDFAELVAPPTMPDGTALCEGADGEYTFCEGRYLRLSLPRATELRIRYRRSLALPTEGELPLSEEEAALMPLFCAAYVFLDEEPERSSFYLARFREGLSAIATRDARVSAFRDTTGWG